MLNSDVEIPDSQSEIRSRKGIGGPKTEEGKKRSSMNALKHGYRAARLEQSQIVEETDREFMQVLEPLVQHYQPKDPVEDQLVRRIAVCTWRLHLSEKMERQQRSCMQHRYIPTKSLERISNYEKTVDINLHRAIRALNRKRYFESLAKSPK